MNSYTQNSYGFKNCSETYRTINGEKYTQWSDTVEEDGKMFDITTKEMKQKALEIFKNQNPEDTFKAIKVSDFYRIYIKVK
jgi:hypothetical protein